MPVTTPGTVAVNLVLEDLTVTPASAGELFYLVVSLDFCYSLLIVVSPCSTHLCSSYARKQTSEDDEGKSQRNRIKE